MRNALAHGEPVELAALQSDELMDYRRILKPFKPSAESDVASLHENHGTPENIFECKE